MIFPQNDVWKFFSDTPEKTRKTQMCRDTLFEKHWSRDIDNCLEKLDCFDMLKKVLVYNTSASVPSQKEKFVSCRISSLTTFVATEKPE